MKNDAINISDGNPFIDKRYRIFFHLLFWITYVGSITLFFGEMVGVKKVFIHTIIAASFNAGLVYFNLYFLLPRYFEKQKFIRYILLIHLVLLLVTLLRLYIDYSFRIRVEDNAVLGVYLLSIPHFISIVVSGYMVLLLTMSLKFIKDYFLNIDLRHRLEYQKVDSELKQLKNQINPHFLFNVLGNIYTLAYMKSDVAPVMISKLSDMMRYVLYDCQAERVPLVKEINYLQDYIALHQLRKENKMNVVFEVEGDVGSLLIQPLLFLPLFENCFKHGNLEDIETGWMKSKIGIIGNTIELTIENTFADRSDSDGKNGGIGLCNIRERLELLYPSKHTFVTETDNNIFSARLRLVLD